jgi:hypothetical protein
MGWGSWKRPCIVYFNSWKRRCILFTLEGYKQKLCKGYNESRYIWPTLRNFTGILYYVHHPQSSQQQKTYVYWNITNFVMLFHAVMEFCLDLLSSKFWLMWDWSMHCWQVYLKSIS